MLVLLPLLLLASLAAAADVNLLGFLHRPVVALARKLHEAARQRRNSNDRALRAVVSVHEDIGASQTRPARVKTSPRMPDFLTCKLHGRALAVMLCEDDGGGSSAFPPGPILRRQWD